MNSEVTGKQIHAKLINLRNDAGNLIYERLTLADKLLSLEDWVKSQSGGGGNLTNALNRIEVDCFGDICGAMSLAEMLEILHNIPNFDVWKESKFHLTNLYYKARDIMREAKKEKQRKQEPKETNKVEFKVNNTEPSTPIVNLDRGTTSSETIKEENFLITIAKGDLDKLREENSNMKLEISNLTKENRKLKRKIQKIMAAIGVPAPTVEVA